MNAKIDKIKLKLNVYVYCHSKVIFFHTVTKKIKQSRNKEKENGKEKALLEIKIKST